MIVATAGHIDHGKTRLVRALTGVDTDRLPEERARGISIDLGFAHADLGCQQSVSFIDVPGHERFIRNMLAGVSGIDAALLVVAADDGVMPQTREHLHILDLLEIRDVAIVVTKMDVVTPARLAEVETEIRALLREVSLQRRTFLPVSAVNGHGLPELSNWLCAVASQTHEGEEEGRLFRMPIDRAFTIPGRGTVITGTVHAGSVSTEDRLLISPTGLEVRVRGLQVRGAPSKRAVSRQRCALNLVGAGVNEVGRGHWMLSPSLHAPTDRIDARMRILALERAPLEHWTPVHLHIGTEDVVARVAIAGEGSIAPGGVEFVQLVTERPIVASYGDHFIVRDQSARITLGGGIVLDPAPPRRKRSAGLRSAELQVLLRRSPSLILAGLLELSETGIDLGAFARSMNLTEANAETVYRAADSVVLGKSAPIGITRVAADALTIRVLAYVRDFHSRLPRATGIEIVALKQSVCPRLAARAFQAFLRELANRQLIVLSNDVVRLPEHDASGNPEDDEVWVRVRDALLATGVQVPLLPELASALHVNEQMLREFMYRKSRTGEVRRLTSNRFCLRATLASVAAAMVRVAQSSPDGFFTAADLRNAIGTGRGLAIHYLEFFDQVGITQRFADRRRVGRDYKEQLGEGEALPEP